MPDDTETQKMQLLKIIKKEALDTKTSRVLSSGEVSTNYIDGRVVTLSAKGAYLTATIILDMLWSQGVAAIGGPTLGASPMVGAAVALSHKRQLPIQGFLVKKNGKVKGYVLPGKSAVIVDDTANTGESIVTAIDAAEDVGYEVVMVIVLVDRENGAREKIEARGITFASIFTKTDLGI